jgi:hypothetical protein
MPSGPRFAGSFVTRKSAQAAMDTIMSAVVLSPGCSVEITVLDFKVKPGESSFQKAIVLKSILGDIPDNYDASRAVESWWLAGCKHDVYKGKVFACNRENFLFVIRFNNPTWCNQFVSFAKSILAELKKETLREHMAQYATVK